jgi:hypothetical protein
MSLLLILLLFLPPPLLRLSFRQPPLSCPIRLLLGPPRLLLPVHPQHLRILYGVPFIGHVTGVPCHSGMERPQLADGGDGLQIWWIAANILDKQSRTADKGCSSSLGVRRGAKNSSP